MCIRDREKKTQNNLKSTNQTRTRSNTKSTSTSAPSTEKHKKELVKLLKKIILGNGEGEAEEQGGEQRYILVKLLNYGPEPNYQIRPTQSINAISKLTSEHADCLAYQYAKTLIKLLGLSDVGSYLLKKAFLANTNYNRDIVAVQKEGEHERAGLLALLRSPEFVHTFVRKIDLSKLDEMVEEGIITL